MQQDKMRVRRLVQKMELFDREFSEKIEMKLSDIKKSRGWEYQELKINLDGKTVNKIIDRVIEIYTYEQLNIFESMMQSSKEFDIDEETIRNILVGKFKNVKLGDYHANSVCDSL